MAFSISNLFKSMKKSPDGKAVEAESDADRGQRLLRDAELSLVMAAVSPEERARALASLVTIKESAGQRAAATLQLVQESCDEILDNVARAAALLHLARASRAAGVPHAPALASSRARLGQTFSCSAARVRAEIASFEFESKEDPSAMLKAAKQILEAPAHPSEMTTVYGFVAVCEAQMQMDPDATFKRATFFLDGESNSILKLKAQAVLSGQLVAAGRKRMAAEILETVKGVPGEYGPLGTTWALGEMALSSFRDRDNDEALALLDKLPVAAPLSDRVAAMARSVTTLMEKDEPELARKLYNKLSKLLDQGRSGEVSILGLLTAEAAEALAIAQSSIGLHEEAKATAENAGDRKASVLVDIHLAMARLGARLVAASR